MGYIYLYSFPDGSKYVGQTVQKINERCSHHKSSSSNCRRLKDKLQEFKNDSGEYNYEFKILIEVDRTLLGEYEKKFINEYNTYCGKNEENKLGLNCTTGGETNKIVNEVTKQKISESAKKYCENNKEKFKGTVYKIKNKNKFQGSKVIDGKRISLGVWNTEEEARNAIKVFSETGEKLYLTRINNEISNNVKTLKSVNGIFSKTNNNKWKVSKRKKGVDTYLGIWNTRAEAENALQLFLKDGTILYNK